MICWPQPGVVTSWVLWYCEWGDPFIKILLSLCLAWTREAPRVWKDSQDPPSTTTTTLNCPTHFYYSTHQPTATTPRNCTLPQVREQDRWRQEGWGRMGVWEWGPERVRRCQEEKMGLWMKIKNWKEATVLEIYKPLQSFITPEICTSAIKDQDTARLGRGPLQSIRCLHCLMRVHYSEYSWRATVVQHGDFTGSNLRGLISFSIRNKVIKTSLLLYFDVFNRN